MRKFQARFESNTFLFRVVFFITVDFLILIKKRDVYLYGNVIQTIVLDETVTGLRTLVVY